MESSRDPSPKIVTEIITENCGKSSPKIVTENHHRKQRAFSLPCQYHSGYWDYFCLPLDIFKLFLISCLSPTLTFFDMALQGRDQFHPPGTVFMHDYVGFCAQPVWPALGKKPAMTCATCLQIEVGSLMISQLYVWSLEDFLRAWYLLREPLVMQAGSGAMMSHVFGNQGLPALGQCALRCLSSF